MRADPKNTDLREGCSHGRCVNVIIDAYKYEREIPIYFATSNQTIIIILLEQYDPYTIDYE